ncbi:MAG: RNA polymerase sigma factor [Pirellulales bacterium]|nr:RNA polymerase sigma factor [Pirellulales bacterium]
MEPSNRIQRDRMLRRAVLAGDDRAWLVWYEESFDELYAYVHWRCGARRDQADEVVQETWLTAVRQVRKFDPARASFLIWLRGIATNVLRSHMRKQMTSQKHRETVDVETLADASADLHQAKQQRKQRGLRVAQTLNRLPDHYDEVLRAKYLDNLTVAQIATVRGETPKAIESLLGRARSLFREIYQSDKQE